MKAYIKSIAYYLPENVEENPPGRLRKKTGIERRHICSSDEIASDLAFQAAEKLFASGVDRSQVDYLILCTQSPDYYLPTTACILQNRLELPAAIGAVDCNLGCSGYVYGLGMAKGLIESGQVRSVLLLTAETYSKYIHPDDNAVRPIFGDGATATLITAVESEMEGIAGITYGTDGGGAEHLIVPVGGMKHPYTDTGAEDIYDDFGNHRTNRNLYMNGSAIMNFTLAVAPETVEKILVKTGLAKNDIDYFVFHQANKFMLKFLQEKCGLLECPYWNDVTNYGNTVSNSIPIALCDMLQAEKNKKLEHVMLMGFGVGLSWAGCVVNLEKVESVSQ